MVYMDKVSSVVSMLNSTLECKKLSNQIEKSAEDDSSTRLFPSQEVVVNTGFDQGKGNQLQEIVRTFHEIPTIKVKDNKGMQKVERTLDFEMEGFVNLTNANPLSRNTQEPSQSESSGAAPVVSSGIDACDGPATQVKLRAGNRSSENGSR